MAAKNVSTVSASKRDRDAGIKLLGGLLRLDMLCPDGFTARQLAEVAAVGAETARAFLNADKGPGYAQAIPRGKISNERGGRPRKLYRLKPDLRSSLVVRLAQLRAQIDGPPASDNASQLSFSSLQFLEEAIEGLASLENEEGWERELADVRRDVGGCEADFRSLSSRKSPLALEFSRRLNAAKQRLEEIESERQPSTGMTVEGDMAWHAMIAALVTRFGRWMNGAPASFEPVLALFDGVRGHDALTASVVKSCPDNVRVAAFDLTSMGERDRAQLFAAVDTFRSATPLAACQMVLTLGGRSPVGQRLAVEFRELSEIGRWQKRLPFAESGLEGLDVGIMRRSYLSQLDQILEGSRVAGFAKRVFSALSTIEAVDAVDELPRLSFTSVEDQRAHLMRAANNILGEVICIDADWSPEIENRFEGSHVSYINAMRFLSDSKSNVERNTEDVEYEYLENLVRDTDDHDRPAPKNKLQQFASELGYSMTVLPQKAGALHLRSTAFVGVVGDAFIDQLYFANARFPIIK